MVVSTAKRVSIEEKPEVRKAGGVYYTPKYIVDYIVANTVGKLIEGKAPKEITQMRFADIACSSGSFLIGVYDLLLEYHKKYYNEKLSDKTDIDRRSEDFGYTEYKDGQWILTLKLKQDILLNNIYGVDIDAQAVEVTQLSLFLKMLEDESLSTTQIRQGAMFSKVLPDLSKNIVCGNSLIGTDILHSQLFSFEEEKKLNPMDYETTFPEVMRKGGFDAIVGNPPYVFGRDWKLLGIPEYVKQYFQKWYESSPYQLDMFSLCMEKSLTLTKENGFCSYIVPNVWLTNTFSEITRKYIFENSNDLKIVVPKSKVFKWITVDTIIYILIKGRKPIKSFDVLQIDEEEVIPLMNYDSNNYVSGKKPISTSLNQNTNSIIDKMQSCKFVLGNVSEITRGIHPYRVGGYGQSAYSKGFQT